MREACGSPRGAYSTEQGYPQKCPQEIFGEEEKPQSGLGGQASLVCPPASARFDEVCDPRNPQRRQCRTTYIRVSPNKATKTEGYSAP